jgi:hypothetical protein
MPSDFDPYKFDPLKSLDIDPFRYVNDPFASVNKQLKAIGLDPIGFGTPVAARSGIPSAHTAIDDLAPEQLAEAKQKAGGGLLSGLEWVGRKLEGITGLRAIKGVLGGRPREILSAGPLALISDELGLTDPKDIVRGRELVEKAGIIGPNEPGLDWGDVVGFGAEVLLDPATYFFGLGLASKGARAATQAGKSLSKINRLDDILALGKTKKGAKALGLPHTMGPRQTGMHVTLNKAVDVELAGGLDDILGMPGTRHPGKLVPGKAAKKSSILGEIADTGDDISRVMNQPITTPASVGLPNFLANVGFGKLRPLKGLARRPMNFQPGGRMEQWAGMMDKLGETARWSWAGRQVARAFEPKLRKSLAGERVPLTRAAQEASLQDYRFMEQTAQQAHSAGYEFGQKWNDTVHFDAQKIVDDVSTPQYQNIKTLEDGQRQVQKNFDYLNAHAEGYQINKAGNMEIPEWHPEVIQRIENQYGNRLDDFSKKTDALNKKMNDLEKERFAKAEAFRKTGGAEAGKALMLQVRSIPKQIDELKVLRDELKVLRDADSLQLQTVQASRSSDDISRAIDHTRDWKQKEWQLKGGVYNRADLQLPAHLQEFTDDIAKIAKMQSDALAYGASRGLDIEQLADNYAMFSPRKLFRVPETTRGGILGREATQRGYSGYGTQHQLARAQGMRGWFGGTSFINKLSRNENYVGRIVEGMGKTQRDGIITDIAEELTGKGGELRAMLDAGGESRKALVEMTDKAGIPLATAQGAWVGNPASRQAVRELAEFLGELDPRLLDYGVTAFEQNPIVAMMSYYVDVVRASHSVEIAANLIGEHADLMDNLLGAGYQGKSILSMMQQWNRTNRAIPPALHFQVIKKMANLNDNWPEMFSSFVPKAFSKLDETMVEAIKYGEVDDLVMKFGDDTVLLREIRTVFDDIGVPKDLGEDVARYVQAFVDPSSMGEFAQAWDHVTDILKTSFTTPWPAFHFRNALSGLANNYLIGAYDPTQWGPFRYSVPVREARTLLRGGTISGIADKIPRFRGGRNIPDWAVKDPDGYVSEWIRSQSRAYDLIGPQHTREHLQAITERGGQYDLFRSRFYDEVPGERVLGQRVGDAWYGKGGILKRSMGSAREFGHEVEGYNRLSPMIAFLKQGLSFDEAVKKVKLAQVDYSALTDIERRVFRRIIPFYTFTRRQIPFVIDRLADPSGSMSQAVKGISRIKREMDDEENPTPDWISSEFTIPIPGGAEGQRRYLTRAGGMLGGMEDVFSLLKPGRTAMGATRRTLSGIGSRMHPALQVPIELGTGQSLFLQRPLSETKPATARLIGGLTGAEQVPSFPGPLVESVISRLPGFGRSVSTLRSLTDPRRPLTVEGEVSALNVAARILPSLTGLRISEVNMDRIKNRVMQEAIEEHLKHNTSIRTFKHIYVPEAELENMDEESRALYLLYKQISSQAAKASRARKKEEATASAYSM